MHRLILTRADTQTGTIQAIKTVRAATGLDLRESRDIVFKLRDSGSEVELKSFDSLREAQAALNHLQTGGGCTGRIDSDPERAIPATLAIDFMLDALAWMPPQNARRLMQQPAYQTLKEALR